MRFRDDQGIERYENIPITEPLSGQRGAYNYSGHAKEQWGSEGEIIDYRGNYKPALWSSTVQAFIFNLKHGVYGWPEDITDKINFIVRASFCEH